MIISSKLATLKELKYDYTYMDCLNLLDIILTDKYNEIIVHKNIESKNGRN